VAPFYSARNRIAAALAALLVSCLGGCAVERFGLGYGDAGGVDANVVDANGPDASDGGQPPDTGVCTGREIPCLSGCVDPLVDPDHCGSCDPCPASANATATCAEGLCGFACDTGFVDCDGNPANGCEADTLGDPATCGDCAQPCPERFGTAAGCTGGVCTYDCGGGLADCDGNATNGCEANTTSDPLHCGSCSPCPARAGAVATCEASACVYTCEAGLDDCDGNVANGCEADLTAPATCGTCLRVCPGAPFATATCLAGGACSFACDVGRANCDGNPSNGCEINTAGDLANCGGCGVPCTGAAGTTATCASGVCTVACAGGRLECDGNPANGCEVDPTADPLHCGSCAPCPAVAGATAGCAARACTYVCTTDYRDCDTLASNGCETDIRTSVANCGGCTLACTVPANATATCAGRTCGFACVAPFADCDGAPGNGCERDTSSDVLHCTGCGLACPVPAHAAATCAASGCGYTCVGSFNDCDGVASNGCESNPSADPLNCGACGGVCGAPAHATATCTASGCGYACIAPYEDCDGLASNGCEINTQTDLSNCGTCTNVCATPAHAAPSCAGSGCGYSCVTPWGDCDGAASNGCELDTQADLANCGACNNVCPVRANATATCAASACGFTCGVGYDNCDGAASNGCEAQLATSAANCGGCGNACPTGRACVASACKGWTSVATVGAPSARMNHTAVWTGTVMIVWGGESGGAYLGDGAMYNPATNTWTAVTNTNAPSARRAHTAVWTGTEMIVWGGNNGAGFLNTGARYNPSTNAWATMTTTNAPGARSRHAAVWTGSRMLVWGGWTNGGGGDAGDGFLYDPVGNAWSNMTGTNRPADRRWPSATFTGTRMVVWGGESGGGGALNDGNRYDPVGNAWSTISTTGRPAARARQTDVWTGAYVVLWGGDDGDAAGVAGAPRSDGGRYDPVADSWAATAASPVAARTRHTSVWTGTRMLTWGGTAAGGAALGDGGSYDPTGTGAWTTITMSGAPAARTAHTAVWTGTEMIVWGGGAALSGTAMADGARLIP
jgi:hypothetical protein